MNRTGLDLAIEWNRNKAKRAKDPRDKARYEQNIKDLELFKKNADG